VATTTDARSRSALRELRALASSCSTFAASFDAGEVAVVEAVRAWQAADAIERAAAAVKTMLAGKVEEAGAWKAAGCRSAAEQLARLGGTTVSVARQSLETSKKLEALPVTAAALRRGDVSVTQAAAIATAAVVAPDAEGRLLDFAQQTNINELHDECLRTRAAADADPDATYQRIQRNRKGRTHTDGEGAWNFHAQGPADAGSRIETALAPLIDAAFDKALAEGRQEAREAYVFDALVALADGATAGSPGEKPKRSKPRYLGLIHVDAQTLQRGAVEGDEVCEIVGIGPIPVRTARELLGDAILKLVITKGVDVANVVHLGRGPTAAQRIALLWQQPKCSNIACSSTLTDTDHREPFAGNRQTVLGNLDRLCKPNCHPLKTYCDWSLVEGKGRRDFVPPTDPATPNTNHPRDPAPRSVGGTPEAYEPAIPGIPRAGPTKGGRVSERTRPDDKTRAAERAEAETHAGADRMPTPEEAAIADTLATDPDVAEHYEEMAERGADQKGEGRIP
jgi:hypothetical protein